jgi:hypothetical protein
MMNEFQRRILAEAAKFGGAAVSKNDKMAKAINEATPFLMGSGGGGTMFGYSKQQFEAKMRQLLQKMGFEKGINKMDVTDKKMVLYFANAAKARDFIITFNGLTKRQSKGSPATISTSFDKVKSPAGTNAVVTVDFSMLKTEGLDRESHVFLMLESLHEEYVTEGGVKAALEDFMYDLPKAAIAELKPLMKQKKGGVAQQVVRLASITAILKKHGVKKELMGFNTANLVNDYFDTFHGESVEVEGEQLSEQQQVIGKYRFTSFTEGSISGWMVSVQGIGEVGFIKAPAKKNTKTSIAPHQLYKTKGQSEGDPKLVMAAFPDSSTRFVNDKEIRFAPRQLLKAVAMWMDKHGKVMTEGTQFVEDGEIEEAKEKYLTGPGKKDPKRIIGIYTMKGKWIKDMNSEKEAANFVNKSWGESVEEEIEVSEAVNIGTSAYQIQRSGSNWEVWRLSYSQGSVRFADGRKGTKLRSDFKTYEDALAYAKKDAGVKEETESVEEAYAHPDEKVVGSFYEKTGKKAFEYRMSKDSWGKSHGLPHEVCVSRKDYKSQGDWRAANVKGTVCYIAVDEGEGGKPVIEKWDIKKHVKYVKAD